MHQLNGAKPVPTKVPRFTQPRRLLVENEWRESVIHRFYLSHNRQFFTVRGRTQSVIQLKRGVIEVNNIMRAGEETADTFSGLSVLWGGPETLWSWSY